MPDIRRAVTRRSLVFAVALAAGLAVAAIASSSRDDSASANPLADIVAVAAGGSHTCALTSGGGVLCWGDNQFGQLGDGTSEDRSKPAAIASLSSGVTAIAAGDHFTCALLSSGGVKCWGYNRYGQLGNVTNLRNSIAPNPLPLDVTGLQGVTAITAGAVHACALLDTGGVKCWGWDRRGQLGDGPGCADFTCPTPRDVSGLTSGVTAIDAGNYHTCAVLTSTALKCWGQNDFGQLGAATGSPCIDEETVPIACAPSPVDIPGFTGVVAVAGGGIDNGVVDGAHTCALVNTGALKCWGDNHVGQLGDGGACGTTCVSPVDVSGLSSGVTAIAVGGRHSCAILSSGGMRCWGSNDFGQLGDGASPNDHDSPVDVCADAACAGALASVDALSLGVEHTCALIQTGLKCWGSDSFGELGDSLVCGVACDTPVGTVSLKAGLPDLVVLSMRVELESGGSCAFTSTNLGVRVEFANVGAGDAGPFIVDVNGVQQTVPGLAAGASSSLWFVGYQFAGPTTAIVDATSLVTESVETNNSLTKSPPVPTLPPTCTPTMTPTPQGPTYTPTPVPRAGDANCDGRTDSIDAALVLQYSAGLVSSLPCQANADVGGPDGLNSIDAALILQFVAGLLPHFV